MIPKIRMWTGSHMIYMDSGRNIESITNCYAQQMLYDALKDAPGPMLFPAYDHVGKHGAAFMLATGIKDVDGREIYEGDVTQQFGGKVVGETEKCKIVFSDGSFHASFLSGRAPWSLLPVLWYSVEVTGNVYENPELLETAVLKEGE